MTQSTSTFGLSVLIDRLQRTGLNWDGENVADLLWLVNYIDPPIGDLSLIAENEVEAVEDELPEADTSPKTEPEVLESRDSVRTETDDSEPALPEITPELALYAQRDQSPERAKSKLPRNGIEFQTPTAPALRQRLELGRSLRPLMRRVESYTRMVLDEAATAEQTAEQQFCMTVMAPARERWLELALVIEDSVSSFLWRDTIRDFQQVLERQGAFRTITTWYLQTDASDNIQLFAQKPIGDKLPRTRSPRELLEASSRRLILVVSDCLSPAWQKGTLQSDYLSLWARHGPLAIVQVLPARMWSQTALGSGYKVSFSALSPGIANHHLMSHPAIPQTTDAGLNLPVMTIEPHAVGQWAQMLAGYGEMSAPGIWFDSSWLDEVAADTALDPDAILAEEMSRLLVDQFMQTASETSRQLAALMALIPVDLSLVYILQSKLLPESTPVHVAEVFLSGLIQRERSEANELPPENKRSSLFITQRQYDFVSQDVRDLLIDTVRIPRAEAVLDEISVYIGQKIGKEIYSFTALLRLEEELSEAGSEFTRFARITRQSVRRLGGIYEAWVNSLDNLTTSTSPNSDDYSDFPPLQILEFNRGELVDAESVEPFPPPLTTARFQIKTISLSHQNLEAFEFKTAKIERKLVGRRSKRFEWIVKKRRAQAFRFIESLTAELVIEMVAIEGGKFLMGAPLDEPERFLSEGPQHEVTVPGFFLGRYPITQAQWSFVANLPQVARKIKNLSFSARDADLPMVEASWYDAIEFCNRLTRHTKRVYRLPSESEWEYACRANTRTPFNFGSTIFTSLANYDSTYAYAGEFTMAADHKVTSIYEFGIDNAFGLCDMHGNIYEWCQDHWHKSYEGAPIDGSAWLSNREDTNRLQRGGSWRFGAWYCRSAHRTSLSPRYPGSEDCGFRVSCSTPGR